MDEYLVKPLAVKKFTVEVPASKSILSRALILAAFTEGDTLLNVGGLAEDTRALLACLGALGISVEITSCGLLVHGTREIAKNAVLNVQSSGTAARFLAAVLSFLGGDYEIRASEQMCSRPMDLVLPLEKEGVTFEFLQKEGRLPFRIHSRGLALEELSCNTDVSTQFASGLMLAAALQNKPCTLNLSGGNTNSSYLAMTAALIEAFGGVCHREGDLFHILPVSHKPQSFFVEPDVSAACYFYALALLCRAIVTVKGVRRECLQGDIRFLELLETRGVTFFQSEEGLTADGTKVEKYRGFTENIADFADQAPTVAALAPFATTPTHLTGLTALRFKESDRISAIENNMHLLGINCRAGRGSLTIPPTRPRPNFVLSYGDHRIAMAFTILGLRAGGVTIRDPACCKKTFENFFEIVESLTAR